MCLNLGLSGYPFAGSDIGGFIGYPSGELFTRWLQLGVFTPLMRAHSVINERNKEPWEFGDLNTGFNRAAIELRYRLLPTLYTLMAEAAETGSPVLRPMLYEYPDDPRFFAEDHQFMFGDNLLVAPVLHQGDTTREVHLPRGVWYDWWTGRAQKGGETVRVDAPLETIPMFVRAGGVLALQQAVQHTGQAPIDPLTFAAFPPDSGESTTRYYEDDGISFRYLEGEYLKRAVTVRRAANEWSVTISAAEGSYRPPTRSLEIHLNAVPGPPHGVTLDGLPMTRVEPGGLSSRAAGWTHDNAGRKVVVRMDDTRSRREIVARF
jgi:alpha-glucosidase